ncbi:hypothetical protein GCM10022199_13420 [Marihabitans asiaticum]|uniref:Uncharacterized protein n=1 Tax=Marihabitans asiaticum TaxID=415218 RepID=A0A560WI32_9MICO|nr:hypothetical protein [Marihabitans asiaticum]TWD17352.1 hypothetical protein FB557_0919 [Marihabitans asiaticum]
MKNQIVTTVVHGAALVRGGVAAARLRGAAALRAADAFGAAAAFGGTDATGGAAGTFGFPDAARPRDLRPVRLT